MDLQLTDKRALITGSTAGIGLAIATALAREGAAVVINGRGEKQVQEAVSVVKRSIAAAKVEGIAADLGSASGSASLVRQLPAVDILVNNLGIFEPKPFAEINDADWLL